MPAFEPIPTWSQLAPQKLFERVAQAGIQGMGGGGFSTARKLELARAAMVTRVIANAVECEPGIAVDAALLAEHSAEVVQGLRIVMSAIGATQGVLAFADDFSKSTRDNLKQQFESPTGAQQTNPPDLTCLAIQRTPGAGAERSLCEQLFDLRLRPDQFPIECGVLCLNVGTLFAIQQAVVLGEPLKQRLVTVQGHTRWVALGTPLGALLDITEQPQPSAVWRFRIGGHYTGKLSSPSDLVTAATNAVWLVDAIPHSPCTYCSRCSDACPEALAPQTLLRLCQQPQPPAQSALLASHGLWRCTECGLCNNKCPSNIDLLESFQQAKANTRAQQLAAATAERAKRRHERHLVRIQARAQRAAERRESRRQSRRSRQGGPDAWR